MSCIRPWNFARLLVLLLVAVGLTALDPAPVAARSDASSAHAAKGKSTKTGKGKTSKSKKSKKSKKSSKSKKSKKSKRSAKRGKTGPRFIQHPVLPGDSLHKIAFKYDVTIKELKSWNKLRSDRIYVGDKLKVKVTGHVRSVKKHMHEVKSGETLSGIAKKYHVSVGDLLAINRLKSKHMLRIGQELAVYVEGPEEVSESIGRPQSGHLVSGVQMRKGKGYTLKRPANAWGTDETVHTLVSVAKKLQKDSRGRSPWLVIGDISREGGGSLPPHKSHQNGRDVDISYIHTGDKRPKGFQTATKENLDLKNTWLLVRALLESGKVERMFIDRTIQVRLCDYVKRHAARKYRRKADEIFQYPSTRTGDPIIRHEPGHKNHIHVRFKTPSDIAG